MRDVPLLHWSCAFRRLEARCFGLNPGLRKRLITAGGNAVKDFSCGKTGVSLSRVGLGPPSEWLDSQRKRWGKPHPTAGNPSRRCPGGRRAHTQRRPMRRVSENPTAWRVTWFAFIDPMKRNPQEDHDRVRSWEQPKVGFEPTTSALRKLCSAVELLWHRGQGPFGWGKALPRGLIIANSVAPSALDRYRRADCCGPSR